MPISENYNQKDIPQIYIPEAYSRKEDMIPFEPFFGELNDNKTVKVEKIKTEGISLINEDAKEEENSQKSLKEPSNKIENNISNNPKKKRETKEEQKNKIVDYSEIHSAMGIIESVFLDEERDKIIGYLNTQSAFYSALTTLKDITIDLKQINQKKLDRTIKIVLNLLKNKEMNQRYKNRLKKFLQAVKMAKKEALQKN